MDATGKPTSQYDLHSLILHEVSHYLGFRSETDDRNPGYDPDGIFDGEYHPADNPPRVLREADRRLFAEKYPFVFLDRSPPA